MNRAARYLKTYIDRLPYIRHLRAELDKQGRYRAGHYYSPIPAQDDILACITNRDHPPLVLPGIDMNSERQSSLLAEYTPLYRDFSPTAGHDERFRYYYPNYLFDYSDAFFLYSFMRKNQPHRIVEVGSGFSSVIMLSTIENWYSTKPRVTLVEPNPNRFRSLLFGYEPSYLELIPEKIQRLDLDVVRSLETGDLLFIDSSHQAKCGSDVLFILFDLLPQLKPGVFVQFHDIFHPFEYPFSWLEKGYYYNEAYFMRAFLSYNSVWTVYFSSSYVHLAFGDLVREQLPLCAEWPGSSLYIRKGCH